MLLFGETVEPLGRVACLEEVGPWVMDELEVYSAALLPVLPLEVWADGLTLLSPQSQAKLTTMPSPSWWMCPQTTAPNQPFYPSAVNHGIRWSQQYSHNMSSWPTQNSLLPTRHTCSSWPWINRWPKGQSLTMLCCLPLLCSMSQGANPCTRGEAPSPPWHLAGQSHEWPWSWFGELELRYNCGSGLYLNYGSSSC